MNQQQSFEYSQFPLHFPENKAQNNVEKLADRVTISAGAMIFAHNKVLLDRNEHTDLWSIPGGIVRFDESPAETVKRKLKQELSLNVKIVDPTPYLFHFILDTTQSVDLVILHHFLVKIEGEGRIIMGGDIADYKWESIGNHFRDCYPNVKPAVDYFLNL